MEQNDQVCIAPKLDSTMVHYVLSHSYSVFLGMIILGMALDFIFPVQFFSEMFMYGGLALIVVGSYIIYWAQTTSGKSKKEFKKTGKRIFAQGPYKWSRNPTHVGLSLMTLGFGLLIGSLFIVILTVAAFIITKLVFLKEEENLLEKKYGPEYCEYKEKVSTWL